MNKPSPTSRKKKPRVSRLAPHWQQLAQTELSLRADEREVLKLKDKGLYYILTPKHLLPISNASRIRDYRTKSVFQHVHELLSSLNFEFKEWNPDGYRVYERLGATKGKFHSGILRVEWGYFETAEGVVRHFKYLGPKVKERNMRREFLLMIARLRREKKL